MPADLTSPMESGARVSLEFPESGTCVAVVSSTRSPHVSLQLLDPLPDGEVGQGAALDLFMPRSEGIFYWPCSLSSPPAPGHAEVELLGPAVFVQRRTSRRLNAKLEARVRRVHSARRGKQHPMAVVDLSRGGMKLEGPFQLSTGDTLEVEVELGAPVQLSCRAVMAYPTSEGNWAAHLCFLDGQRESTEVVGTYIAEQIKSLPF